jgi:hypothetical protein
MADVPGTSVERAAEALETESPDVLEEVETTEQLAEELKA